ncbi:hypothetical protein E1B28_013315 [Marasmius oreades]|uniref:PIN domain-containing protein n=1 Tax=Marasmius oreades TaxID=181124 RepID=A0A9P7RPH1_9AGAR|nr:uncharacterized protein E1B28_013315 [Marasmius oreades]KAG7087339.1 hypothetical protein E1B28_013315 [Marasmius oreades]
MTETKLDMSRALGAAFLSHQVEQLEKSLSKGASSGNWRDRRYTQHNNNLYSSGANKKAPSSPKNANSRKKVNEAQAIGVREAPSEAGSNRRKSREESEKDADIIVVDASVLVHSLNQLKKWSRNGRNEVVIVPLEALTSLDLLKKGNNSVAQKARAASRILEAQVGSNPRIRVQQDDAFVLWDKIHFADKSADEKSSPQSPPEWVRKTICCARWEADNAKETLPSVNNAKVVLATCAPSIGSPQFSTVKLSQDNHNSMLSPVPGPSPFHANKHEPRVAGVQVAHWAAKAGLEVLKVEPTAMQPNPNNHARSSSEDEKPKRVSIKGPARRGGPPHNSRADVDKLRGGLVERSPAVLTMMERVKRPDSKAIRVLARGEKLDP